jgi:Ca2+-transporting ATPase
VPPDAPLDHQARPSAAALAGMSASEAERRLAEIGPNVVPQGTRISVLTRVFAQLRDPLILVLLAACVLTVVTSDVTDAVVIAVVVVINTAVGVVQEIRADHAVTALAQMSAPSVRVRRDGVELSVPTAVVVPGDIVLLAEGDIVPADGEVREASSLLVDESALTGESVPVDHQARTEERAGDLLSAGTVVVKGRAVMEVQRTGATSALGQIAAMLDTHPQATPLQVRMAGLSRVLAVIAIGLSGVVLALGLVRGESLEPMVLTAISLAVAAVPESLPAVVTLALALGASRMATRNAIVRRLPAVETLGSVTVLATDKTGTLTGARMVVGELWTPARSVTILGDGYEPVGDLVSEGVVLGPAYAPDVVELLRAAVLCNDATLTPPSTPGEPWSGLGDPTEVALLAAAGKIGLSREELGTEYPRVAEQPFDSESQQMTTVHDCPPHADGSYLVVIKGSPEALHSVHHDGPLSHLWHDALLTAGALADRGYRVLAVAVGHTSQRDLSRVTQVRLLGLLAINDPAKPAARATIQACRDAGIVPILITGDHPATARAIAAAVGILSSAETDCPGIVVTGQQMTDGTAGDLTIPRVFARTNPGQKLDIIQAWKEHGANIAMTGDGVNDGPALRRADVGVAMGHRGTEVARQSADLILADDDLETMVIAIEEGRRVYDNIRRFLIFGLSGGAAEIAVMLIGPFTGLTVPLLAAQILWINLLTHGITGVAIGAEPTEAGTMRRPPRPPEQSILGDNLWQRVLACGFVVALVTIGLGLWAQDAGRPWQSMVFLALTTLQLGVALGLRPRLFTRENLLMPLAVAGSLSLAIAGLYIPVLQELLGTQPLTLVEVGIGVLLGTAGWAAARISGILPGRRARVAG